jgi:hypothetical protein
MQEAGKENPSDLRITIQTQVSDYNYDETEETGIKTSINVVVEDLTMNPPAKKEITSTFEKKYEQHVSIPYGLYFWEASSKVREAIKATLSQF